jgi:hypothetical protein
MQIPQLDRRFPPPPMSERRSYQKTLFDRHGPDAEFYIKSVMWSVVPAVLSLLVFYAFSLRIGFKSSGAATAFILGGAIVVYASSVRLMLRVLKSSEDTVQRVLAGGDTTPYIQQHSYQQALVMQGRLDEALESLEAIIAEPDSPVDVRIRAAELYTREAARHERAVELFRAAIRHPNCTVGEEVYSANRLVDLFTGPLGQPGKAMVELRRLADRYPGSQIGDNARNALRVLKGTAEVKEDPFFPNG